MEKERESQRRKIIEEERQRLLKQHATKLLGYLPKVRTPHHSTQTLICKPSYMFRLITVFFCNTKYLFLFSLFSREFLKKMTWSTLMRISETISNNDRLIFSQMRVGEMIRSRVIPVMTTMWHSF